MLGASRECQSISRAGYRQRVHDPRFWFFFNMVNIIKKIQREQTSPLIYILENTYPRERCTTAVQKAQNLVQGFLGAPIVRGDEMEETHLAYKDKQVHKRTENVNGNDV